MSKIMIAESLKSGWRVRRLRARMRQQAEEQDDFGPQPVETRRSYETNPTGMWLNDLYWCARLGAAGLIENRRVVLAAWVESAGGTMAGTRATIPELPAGIALATLRAHARALGVELIVGSR